MADDFLSFVPAMAVTVDEVRARFDADANAGVDPGDSRYVDLTEGGFYWDATQGAVMECVRLWDFMGTELLAAAFPATSWGEFLDLWGETLTLPRNDEVVAVGEVLFSGDVGTLVPAGTQVATIQPDPSAADEPVSFLTDASITLAAVPGPTNLALQTINTVGGTILAGTYYYVVTAITAAGETIASNEISVSVTGNTNSITLQWSAVAGATAYRIYRSTVQGGETLMASPGGTGLTYTDTGAVVPGTTPAPTNRAAITAAAPGASGNVASGTITQVLSPLAGISGVTNTNPTSGGADVESDDSYKLRIIAEFGQSHGAGNSADYIRWARQIPQVGFATVQPLWNGAGTVRVIITDQSNQPLPISVIQALQLLLDPVPQQGQGLAPIGALVTVTTPTLLTVTVSATVTFESGYSLDGAGGTIATRAQITAALDSYLNTLAPGDDVILYHVVSRFFTVPGVLDVGSVLLNGAAANVVVGALQVATAGTISLS